MTESTSQALVSFCKRPSRRFLRHTTPSALALFSGVGVFCSWHRIQRRISGRNDDLINLKGFALRKVGSSKIARISDK